MAEIRTSFESPLPPDALRRKAIAELSPVIERCGFELAEQSEDALIWKHRYWPLPARLAVVAALVLAVAAFNAASDEGGDATPVILIFLTLGIPFVFIRRTESLSMVLEPTDRGSAATVRGSGPASLRRALDELQG